MSELHLISHHLCPYVQRAVIMLNEKNIPHERTYIDLANKPEWFLDKSPLGRVPILETGDAVIFESQVIVEYLDDVTPGSLHPTDPLEKARHRSWIEFGSETLQAIAAFYSAKDAEAFQEKSKNLKNKFERVEREIQGQYFAGDKFHIIDGVWGTIFRYFDVFDTIADLQVLSEFTKTSSWREAISSRKSVINAVPDGYAERLHTFLQNRKSYLSSLMLT